MNTTNCPYGYFTDEILVLPFQAIECSASIIGWLVLSISLVSIRILFLLPQIQYRKRRLRNMKQRESRGKPSKTTQRRIPFFLISQALACLLDMLFILLVSLNIANTTNGLSIFVSGFGLLFDAIGHLIMSRSVVNLGKRIIPLSIKGLSSSGQQNSAMLDNLSREDTVLKFLGFLALVSIVLFLICASLGYFLGGGTENSALSLKLCYSFVGAYQTSETLVMIYQFQRCINAISRISNDGGGIGDMDQIQKAIQKMKKQQVIILIVASIGFTTSVLVASFIMPYQWYLICILNFFLNALFQGSLLLVGNSHRTKQNKVGGETGSPNNNAASLNTLSSSQDQSQPKVKSLKLEKLQLENIGNAAN